MDDIIGDSFNIENYGSESGKDSVTLQKEVDTFKLTPYGTAAVAERWKKGDGLKSNDDRIILGIHFMDGSEDQKSAVRHFAPQWLDSFLAQKLDFQFDVPLNSSQVRIAFDPDDGNHSKIGRQAIAAPRASKTMNLGQVEQRTILHEFGHVLGLLHEHQNPNSGIQWNEMQVIADLKASQHWSESYIRSNVLEKLSKNYACVGDPELNPASIMMYPIPPGWTLNGFTVDWNETISDRDRKCIKGIYSL